MADELVEVAELSNRWLFLAGHSLPLATEEAPLVVRWLLLHSNAAAEAVAGVIARVLLFQSAGAETALEGLLRGSVVDGDNFAEIFAELSLVRHFVSLPHFVVRVHCLEALPPLLLRLLLQVAVVENVRERRALGDRLAAPPRRVGEGPAAEHVLQQHTGGCKDGQLHLCIADGTQPPPSLQLCHLQLLEELLVLHLLGYVVEEALAGGELLQPPRHHFHRSLVAPCARLPLALENVFLLTTPLAVLLHRRHEAQVLFLEEPPRRNRCKPFVHFLDLLVQNWRV
mmetsp:Transcript_7582/g.32048  ORF Transcript_7582/g.32048 Transcript_7582/m.32048 type:complete len:284 (-) Transcript_7582:838-1689(-)